MRSIYVLKTTSNRRGMKRLHESFCFVQSLIDERELGDSELFEAPRPQGGASRKGDFIYIVPLDPAYPAWAGRGISRSTNFARMSEVFLRGPDRLQPGA
jgi:hypothetical protein